MRFHKDILKIDCEKEKDKICQFIRDQTRSLRREGAVIGLSGGIDSSVCAGLCVQALGAESVLGLILPEKESHPESRRYALRQAEKLGIETKTIDITRTLEALGAYERRDRIIRDIFPEYDSRFKMKITLPHDLLSRDAFNIYTLTIDDGRGGTKSTRLGKKELSGIVAASNTKQRTRMIYLYYHAEKRNYLVCGTTNRSEILQGFFVKYGDGGVDIEPLAHLYKIQVYQMSEYLGVVPEIRHRTPSPDTYSLEVSDEEFYFRMPYDKLDLLLYAWENAIPISQICRTMGLEEEQVRRAFRDFESKSHATRHLRTLPLSMLKSEKVGF